jgi:hypothetical protein
MTRTRGIVKRRIFETNKVTRLDRFRLAILQTQFEPS